eukprot:3584737-Prymnesium_polylepis.1
MASASSAPAATIAARISSPCPLSLLSTSAALDASSSLQESHGTNTSTMPAATKAEPNASA